jgi:hypothetical protein
MVTHHHYQKTRKKAFYLKLSFFLVRRLDELPQNLLSWNNKIPVSKPSNETPSRHKVAVNIIGCHQPIEVMS